MGAGQHDSNQHMIEWSIQARSPACQNCGRGFKDRETLHTLLFDERQAYRRIDVCEPCWAMQYSQGGTHRKGFISHWVGVFAVPPAASPEPIRKETAETLLRKLIEENDPRHAAVCFILAVMLERKRLLKVKAQTTEAGRRVFVYEHARSGDALTIVDPELQLDQLEAVQRDVARLLEHGLTPPPAPAPEPPAASAPIVSADTTAGAAEFSVADEAGAPITAAALTDEAPATSPPSAPAPAGPAEQEERRA